jgi:hypothetical protein
MSIPKIISVEAIKNYKIKLIYETGEIKLFNVLLYISGVWYRELNNYSYFQTVHIIPNGKGIEWEHGQDIAPHELYDMGISIKENIKKT